MFAQGYRQNDYYPFGMVTPGRSFSSGSQYRYGFNGKENDRDISDGAQDYGMRINDVRLGKFLSVDPLSPKYPYLTPYQFASNRPIDGVDQDGKEWSKTEIYDPKTGITNVHFQVKLKISNASDNSANTNAIGKAAIAGFHEAFANVYDEKRKVIYSGDLEYETTDKDLTDKDFGVDLFSAKKSTSTSHYISGFDGDPNTQQNMVTAASSTVTQGISTPRDPNDVAQTITHEMGHTGGLMHPFDEGTNAQDVALIPTAIPTPNPYNLRGNNTPATGANLNLILKNVMIYGMTPVNGSRISDMFKEPNKQLIKFSSDQAHIIMLQIEKDLKESKPPTTAPSSTNQNNSTGDNQQQ